jgi:hypothetical protein
VPLAKFAAESKEAYMSRVLNLAITQLAIAKTKKNERLAVDTIK